MSVYICMYMYTSLVAWNENLSMKFNAQISKLALLSRTWLCIDYSTPLVKVAMDESWLNVI